MNLQQFFGHDIDYSKSFILFSWSHILFISFVVLLSIITILYASKIRNRSKKILVRNIFIVALIALEVWYHVHNWTYPRFSAPLHLCSFSTILSVWFILKKDKRVYDVLFFTGILGGLVAVLLPDNNGYTYLSFRYYHFILLHTLIIIIPLYYYRAYDLHISLKSAHKTFLYLIIAIPIIYTANALSGSNYMFINDRPEIIKSLLPIWPYYLFIFIILAYILIMGIYFIQREKKLDNFSLEK